MRDLPVILSSGERARLIPVVADTSKESRAVSILLATMTCVDNLRRVLLAGIGQRLGSRARVDCFTEVVFRELPTDIKYRPDGLIVVMVGKRTWSAVIEAKIGRSILSDDQIKDYLKLAKLNSIDAVITVSNQFAALPTHHPVRLMKSARRGVDLFHWSWMHILTQATLLLSEGEFSSEDQRFVLEEMVRYYNHDSVGVLGFDRMNAEWKDLVGKVQSGATLNKYAPEVENSVAAWHQESRDICLILSRKLGRDVSLKLSNSHKKYPGERLKADCEQLVKTTTLACILDISDAAAPITVSADLRRRTVSCCMRLDAPKDKKRSTARINWLVRQLASTDPEDMYITAHWPGRSKNTQAGLADVRDEPRILEGHNPSLKPQHFEVLMVKDLAGKFSGTKSFIENLESVVPEYYERVGQHLRAWVAQPPKFIDKQQEAPERQEVPQQPLEGTAPTAGPVAPETKEQPDQS